MGGRMRRPRGPDAVLADQGAVAWLLARGAAAGHAPAAAPLACEPDVSVRIYRPCEPLQSYITFYYFVEADGPLTDFLYPEWGNVRFPVRGDWTVEVPGHPASHPRGVSLFGPTDRHGVIRTGGGKAIGFGMTPIGWHRLVNGSAHLFANRAVPLEERLCGLDSEALHRALAADSSDAVAIARLEAALLECIAQLPPVSRVVLAVDRALRTRPGTVEAFAAAAFLTERTLQRVCLATFGFSPKRLLRLQRFLDTLGHVRAAVGERVTGALSAEYYDAAHFYRDFRDFMAMSPRSYFAAKRPLMGPAAVAQMAAGVTLSFRLPPQPGDLPAPAEHKPD